MLRPKGSGAHGPHFVVEIIPQHGGLPFPDNSADRAGFVTPRAPKRGEQITVTGPYFLDTNALHDLVFPGKSVKNWARSIARGTSRSEASTARSGCFVITGIGRPPVQRSQIGDIAPQAFRGLAAHRDGPAVALRRAG
jgi:hypothetical protein